MHEQGHADPATTWNLYVRANDADVSALAGGLGEVVREANTKPAARPKAIDTKGRNPGAPRPGMRGRHPSVAVSATSSQAGESRDRQTEPERPRASDSAVAAGRSLAPVRSRSAAWGLRDRPVAGPQERQHDDDLRPPCPPGRRDQRAVTCWTPDLDVVVQILGTHFSKNCVPPERLRRLCAIPRWTSPCLLAVARTYTPNSARARSGRTSRDAAGAHTPASSASPTHSGPCPDYCWGA